MYTETLSVFDGSQGIPMSVEPRARIRLSGTYANCALVQELITRATEYIECEGFGHCMRILILRVLHATHAVPIPDEILDNNSDIIIHIDRSVQHMLHNVKGFELQVGGVSDRELLAEYDWKDNTIRLQGGWIAEMNHMLDSLQNPKSNHSSAEREVLESSLKWHKTLVIIKIIHEYMHALTPRIMEFDYDVRTETGVGSVHGTNDRQYISLNNAPALVGSQMACGTKHSRYIGDMGSAMEEVLSGNGVRFNAKFAGRGAAFVLEEIVFTRIKSPNPINPGRKQILTHYCDPVCTDSDLNIEFETVTCDFQHIVNAVTNITTSADISHFEAKELPSMDAPVVVGGTGTKAGHKRKASKVADSELNEETAEEESLLCQLNTEVEHVAHG
jgi:hypothetical protein